MHPHDHPVGLIGYIFRQCNIQVSAHTIEETILTHPEYPSMRCISDALDSWKVKHVVMKLSLEKLRILDVPVIAHLKRREFIWVTQITDTKVFFTDGSGKEKVVFHEQFEKEWSGVVLAVENMGEAGEPDYRGERKKEIKEYLFKCVLAGACTVLLTVLLYFLWTNDSSLPLLPRLLLLSVSAAGCYLGYTLVRQEKHQSSHLAQKFCRAGTHIDCHQVTASPYSKLFGIISWAELGMAYFATVILWTIVAPVSINWVVPLWMLLLVPLPFTLWSLFTQAFLIRKWCLFCCAIVLLLWINTGILYPYLTCDNIVSIEGLALAALLFLVCTAATVMYVDKINKSRDPYSGQREMARIKFDFQTLQGQLSAPQFETGTVGFVFGNLQASHEIILYVSIACSFCDAAVKELRRLTEIYPGLCYRLIFAVKTDDFDHNSNTIIRHLTGLYCAMGQNGFFDVLDAWYATPNKKLETLQATYPVSSTQDSKEEIDVLYRFSQQVKIDYTPAILINGRLLSQLYSYHDLYGIARALNAE